MSDELHQQLAERLQPVYQEIRENVSEEIVEKYLQDVYFSLKITDYGQKTTD